MGRDKKSNWVVGWVEYGMRFQWWWHRSSQRWRPVHPIEGCSSLFHWNLHHARLFAHAMLWTYFSNKGQVWVEILGKKWKDWRSRNTCWWGKDLLRMKKCWDLWPGFSMWSLLEATEGRSKNTMSESGCVTDDIDIVKGEAVFLDDSLNGITKGLSQSKVRLTHFLRTYFF